jgi:hypothetical protein
MLVRFRCLNCTLTTHAIAITLFILFDNAVCAEHVKIESGLIQGTVEDEMPLVFQQFGLPGRPQENAADRAMHFLSDTAHAGPVVNEEGLRELDAYFEWRRSLEAPVNSALEK